jgi:ATP-dependent exoDNAse (exonuclease V) alpha subunit
LVQTLKGIGLRGSSFTVTAADRNGVHVLGDDGGKHSLPFRMANRWSVGEERVISLAKGDEILIRANHPRARLRNGDVDLISHVSPDAIVLKSGRIFSPRDFKQFSHGYAVTSYAAQGQTVDSVIVSAPVHPRQAMSRQGWYVMLSRGRENLRVYTDDWATLKERVKREDNRVAAVELPSSRYTALGNNRSMIARYLTKPRLWKFRPRLRQSRISLQGF